MGNENLLNAWTFKEGACGCSGSYHTSLTDTRILLRAEDSTCCSCNCCNEAGHVDASIFLRDVAEMREARNQGCCITCWTKCCGCCTCCDTPGCCCHNPKRLELRGAFGTEVLHVSKEDMHKAQIEIPAAIGNHKLVSQY
jgi:hypothetical protein